MSTDPEPAQAAWVARAKQVLPAGGLGNFDPAVVIARGRGARAWDATGREYVDFLIGSGPMLLGHGHPEVLDAVRAQLPEGTTFFTSNPAVVELAEEIVRAVACAEQVRFVSTGGEADMFAMRLARAATGRDRIVKFEGGYHGMTAEAQMSIAPGNPGNFPQAVPDSGGIPESLRAEMLVAPFNDAAFIRSLMSEYGSEVAAVIVEPLQRVIPPAPGFLEALRTECDRHGTVLIFDEVVTGFRLGYGGAQELYGVTPDVCTLGKVIGGGFPLAAVAGRESLMRLFDAEQAEPGDWLMQLGTLSGNPVAAVAGLKTLEILRRPGAYAELFAGGQRVMDSLTRQFGDAGVPHQVVGHPALFDVLFTERKVQNYRDVRAADAAPYHSFMDAMRTGGILKSPGKFYPCTALTDADLEQTEAAIGAAVEVLRPE